MSIPFSQFNPLSTDLLVTIRLLSNLRLYFCLVDNGFHTLTPSVKTAVPLSSPCHPSLHSSTPGLCHLIPASWVWTCYSLCLDRHSLKVSQGSAQCHPHRDHPHHPMERSSSTPLCPVTFYHFYRSHITTKRDLGSYPGEEFFLFQSPLLEQKLHEGRTFPVLSTGGHSQCLWSYLAESQMPSEVRQVTAMSDEDRMKGKKEECVLLWVHVPWKAFNIEIMLSNKTHQAAESTLCLHLHIGQARLPMQFPVWYLLSQMVSGKPKDILSSPHAASSWVLVCFFFFQFLATVSHHWQIYSTQDPAGFDHQFSSKTQLPSVRKANWNSKSNVNKRARELE